MDGYVKRFSMRVAPGHDFRIHARDFCNPPLVPDDGYRLVTPTEASQAQLYPYTDLSDHSLFIQAENDLTRDQRASLYECWYTLCPAGFMHLEVREGDHWRPIAVSIMLPLSGAGFKASIDQVDAVARAEFATIKAALKQIESAPRARRDRAGAAGLVLQGVGRELRPRPR